MGEIRREVKTFEFNYYCDRDGCHEKMLYQAGFYDAGNGLYRHICYNRHEIFLKKAYPYTRTERV